MGDASARDNILPADLDTVFATGSRKNGARVFDLSDQPLSAFTLQRASACVFQDQRIQMLASILQAA